MRAGLRGPLLLLMLLVALQTFAANGEVLAPDLEAMLAASPPGTTLPVVIRLRDRLDARAIERDSKTRRQSLRARRARLSRELKAQSGRRAYRELKSVLRAGGAQRVRELWLINALAAEVSTQMLDALRRYPEVVSIRYDASLDAPPVSAAQAAAPQGWNLAAVGAPALWQLGWTGQGVVVATLDSGVDALHPDLAGSWRGGANSWFDPAGVNATPFDATGHGTQVLGLILGGDNSGANIGMAPGASWIAAKIFDNAGKTTVSKIHASLQWVLDPDDDPLTDDAPDIVNNSWSLLNSAGQCDTEFLADLVALRAAEIAVVFAAGNSGPNPSTSMSPANNEPVSFGVGSVDQGLQIDSSSARGPSACTGSFFPHLVAPGVNVESTGLTFGGLFPDSYDSVSGTSFSASHVSGALALLASAVPAATLDQLEAALLQTPLDLGAIGPDDIFGAGLLDVAAAHQHLTSAPVPALSGPARLLLMGLLGGAGALLRQRRPRSK